MKPGDALNRHSTLIAHGWTYDPRDDLYTPPGGGRRIPFDAAWATHTKPKPSDPRRSAPQ